MIRLSPSLLPTLCFSPDDPVLAMFLSLPHRRCVLAVTEASAGDLMLSGVRVELTSWQALRIEHNDVSQGLRVIAALPDELADLCEFEMTHTQIRIGGFGRYTHEWYALTFQGAVLSVQYDSTVAS